MVKGIFLILLFFAAAICNAQKGMPSFGNIDKADLQMTDCDFDKGAAAVKLIDWGYTYYDKGNTGAAVFKTIFERRTRIKILTENGLSYADVHIPYYAYNNDEDITKISACTYNLDAAGKIQTTVVRKNAIYRKKINKYYYEMIIAFPEAKAGSVIEYKYTMERQTMGKLRDWFFQERIPVKFSRYQLKIPQIFRFSVQPSVIDSLESTEEVIDEVIVLDKGQIKTKSLLKSYTMQNLPGIKDEPFMCAAKDYMQRLEFQLSQIDYGNNNIEDLRIKWSDVINDLSTHENFGMQLDKTIPETTSLINAANAIPTEEGKMKFIFNELKKNVNWNEHEAMYTENGITKTWKTKTGNTADINLLLVKLLSDAGLKAHPILFSTRDNGQVNTHYPFLNQFNTVMAYVTINGNYFLLDATDKLYSLLLIPEKIINTYGFIVEGDEGRWEQFTPGKLKYKIMTAIRAEIDSAGIMAGDALVNCSEYARKERCDNLLKGDKESFKSIYFSGNNNALKIDSLMINNINIDSLALEQKVTFKETLNRSGRYSYFSVNLFSGLDNNAFTADDRISDIDFGVEQQYLLFGNYSIPDNYSFDVLPENVIMIMPDTSIIFTRSMQADENLLNVRITVEFKKAIYSAALYPEFAAFYKRLIAALNEQVVIKKKETP